jgi:hypothetical protein
MLSDMMMMRIVVVVVGGFLGTSVYKAGGVDEFAYSLFPYVPSTYFQAFGAWYVRLYTCHALPAARSIGLVAPAVKCSTNDSALYVIVTGAKGGTVLAARAAVEIAATCGKCAAIGYRAHGRWPPVQETMPTYRSDVLLAIANAQTWPHYAFAHGGPLFCAVITRDPFERFVSLFQYMLDGSEYDLREPSKHLHGMLSSSGGFAEALTWMWVNIGRETMINSHAVLTLSIKKTECVQVKFEEFSSDFDRAAERWANAWGVLPNATSAVIQAMRRHDMKRKSKEALKREHHVSGGALSKKQKDEMVLAVRANAGVMQVLEFQRRELGYGL